MLASRLLRRRQSLVSRNCAATRGYCFSLAPVSSALLWLCAAIAAPALATPRTVENARGTALMASHLVDHPEDTCRSETFQGRVVAREFSRVGTRLAGVTLEYPNGTREFVNVAIPDDLDMARLGHVVHDLQQLSKIGRRTSGRLFRCGAAGRVLNLDSMR